MSVNNPSGFVNGLGTVPLLPVKCLSTSSDSEGLSVLKILGYACQVRIKIWFDERTGEVKLPFTLLNRVSFRKSNRASHPYSGDVSFPIIQEFFGLVKYPGQVLTAGF